MGFEKVNFDGLLAFSLEQHRARILPSSSPSEVPDRAVQRSAQNGTFDIKCTVRPTRRNHAIFEPRPNPSGVSRLIVSGKA
jgi:hypothetical protein